MVAKLPVYHWFQSIPDNSTGFQKKKPVNLLTNDVFPDNSILSILIPFSDNSILRTANVGETGVCRDTGSYRSPLYRKLVDTTWTTITRYIKSQTCCRWIYTLGFVSKNIWSCLESTGGAGQLVKRTFLYPFYCRFGFARLRGVCGTSAYQWIYRNG
jgi:hypothetical protein